MGKDRGHTVYPDMGVPQFLLDLVWWRDSDSMDIVLAVESEWGKNWQVWEDFGKLLVVKSPLKLMVFEKQPKDTVETIEQLYMQRYTQHVKGEQYLLIEFDTNKSEAHPFHFSVPSDGRLKTVTFRSVPTIDWSK